MRKFTFILLGALFLTSFTNAAEWTLSPIKGHQPNKWDGGDNWTHARGNPYKADGGEWLLAFQDKENPAPEDEYTPMQGGTYVNYYYVWKAGDKKEKDPHLSYRGTSLSARPNAKEVHASRSAAILFTPDEAGKYKIKLSGQINIQNHTAGNGRVVLGVLSTDGKSFTTLKQADLNVDKTGAYGKFPKDLLAEQSIEIKQGEKIVLRLQSISPGKATAGKATLKISEYSITKE